MIEDTVIDQSIAELEQRKEKLKRLLRLQSELYSMETRITGTRDVTKAARVILSVVCEHFGVNPEQVNGKKRPEHLVVPRHIYMYILREDCDITLDLCGQLVGGRDHGTVMHAQRAIKDRIETDLAFAATLAKIREECRIRTAKELAGEAQAT